jgi:DNA-binding NtrC family response regulator
VTDTARDILIVDDEELICFVLENLFKVHGFSTRTASRGEEALAMLTDRMPALVVMDIRMPGLSGFDVLARAKQIDPQLPVILMTALAGVRDAVEAMRAGAFDYIAKPFNNNDMMDVVRRALQSASDAAAQDEAEDQRPLHPLFEGVGESETLRVFARRATALAALDTPFLLVGEIGVGKRMFARLIHQISGRHGDFVAVDCTGADTTWLRRELYGNPASLETGRLEAAAAGTLLLDEINEPPSLFQEAFADVLRSGRYSRDGGETMISHHARVILAATMEADATLDDIGISPYLLDVFRGNILLVPPLRERREDIPLLVHLFVRQAAEEVGVTVPDVIADAMEVLVNYDWPGNAHQLRTTLRRALLSAGDTVTSADLDLPVHPRQVRKKKAVNSVTVTNAPLKEQVRGYISDIERQVLLDALRKTGWNKAHASRLLRITYKTMLKKIQDHTLEKPQ